MLSDYLHKNCYFEAENVENKILYFSFNFLNAVGLPFIAKYAFYSKLKFERNLMWFYVNEILSVACMFVVTVQTVMTNCIFKTAT